MDEATHDLRGEPPADPEEWSDEEWLAWLRATDEPMTDRSAPRASTGSRIAGSRSASIIGESMLALSQAIYGRRDDDIVIVAEGDSTSASGVDFEVHLDPDHPERSSVVFRRHSGDRNDTGT